MKTKVALLTGGYSGESIISLRSSQNIARNIDHTKHDIYILHVTKDNWYYDNAGQQIPVDKNDFSIKLGHQKITFDVAMIMIHGTPGEDGLLQGYLEMIGLPFTTCSSSISALTFHKYICNNFVRSFGLVNVAPSILVRSVDQFHPENIINQIKLPCFVKPEAGGSSIGSSRVNKAEDLLPALHKALCEDKQCLIERFIAGREITCGVIRHHNQIIALPLTEIISKKEFFDYEAKYTPSLADEITPAPLDQTLTNKIQSISAQLYDRLLCRGVVRFDYIVNEQGIWFLEVNTIPGMTAESIIPKQAQSYGWSMTELIEILISEAFNTH